MAVIGFNFSNVYKDSLLSGEKTATVVLGQRNFGVGDEVLVLLPEGSDMFAKGARLNKIGTAKITMEQVIIAKFLTEDQATKCGYSSIAELKESLVKWYGATSDSILTYIEFDLHLD